jgi:ribonuclease HI
MAAPINYIPYDKLVLNKGLVLFTDGSTWNNGQSTHKDKPCIGGWGFVVLEDGEMVHEDSGGEVDTSISRMELLGIISGLESLTENAPAGTKVTVVSDSQYCVKGATEWLRGWLKRGWKNNEGVPTANQDLWKRLVKLSNASNVLSKGSHLDVTFSWVRGHVGHQWNERCDLIAGDFKNHLLRENGIQVVGGKK